MLLSIITVTKDDSQGLSLNLESTKRLRQSPLVEQIVIDSSVEAEQLASEALCRETNGVRYLHQPAQGISPAFNLGLQEAQGQFVWYLNGGDEFHSDCPEDFLLKLLSLSQADALIFEMQSIKGISRRPAFFTLWPPVFNWVPHPSTILRRSCLKTLGGFRHDFMIAMDVELWLRLLSSDAAIDLISIPLARFAPGGLSSYTPRTAAEIRRAMWLHRKTLFWCFFESGHKVWRAFWHFGRRARGR